MTRAPMVLILLHSGIVTVPRADCGIFKKSATFQKL